MRWQGRERSSNIEDRTGQAPGGASGGFGRGGFGGGMPGGVRIPMGRSGGGIGGLIGLVVVLGIIWAVTGTNPLDMLTGGGSSNVSSSSQSQPIGPAGQDELKDFVAVVVKETETLWTTTFQQNNLTYRPPTVVFYTGQTQAACGGVADASSGPFYCPEDKKVYIDLSFYQQLREQFGAPGDFAQAYVIAHEVGHAVQDQLGVLPKFEAFQTSGHSQEQINAYSVRIELQADCYAGVWGNFAKQENILENGDYEEAVNAANQIGDDTLTRGQVSSRNFTHGTSEQRKYWFSRGFKSGDPGQCDTFASGAV